MTDSMVERVARAICHSSLTRDVLALNEPASSDPGQLAVALAVVLSKEVDSCWSEFEDDARAAIEAMREPTAAMCSSGYSSGDKETIREIWQEMIDVALAEPARA